MLTTAAAVAVLLLILGGLLTRLLHFSPGALGVASGIILLVIAVTMVLGQREANGTSHSAAGQDPMQVAVFPLAVPYLLNPAGIVVLVTASAEASTVAVYAVVVAILIVILAVDVRRRRDPPDRPLTYQPEPGTPVLVARRRSGRRPSRASSRSGLALIFSVLGIFSPLARWVNEKNSA